MIKLADLTKKDIGRWVQYTAHDGAKTNKGRIKGWNHAIVWVVYACDDNWDDYQNYTGAPTDAGDLEFIDASTNA